MNRTMTPTPPPAQSLPYESPAFAPKLPLLKRLNWRIIVFAAIIVLIPGYFVGSWAIESVTGGIRNVGNYKLVDLKAMSTFSMDQQNGTIDDIPSRFRSLEGQEVILEGEMWSPH